MSLRFLRSTPSRSLTCRFAEILCCRRLRIRQRILRTDDQFFRVSGDLRTLKDDKLIPGYLSTIYEEGCEGRPAMITIALHARYMGQPGRFPAIKKFVVSVSSLSWPCINRCLTLPFATGIHLTERRRLGRYP